MTRVSRIKTALAATLSAACLAVGAAAAPAQASNGLVEWEDGYEHQPMVMYNLPAGACQQVSRGSRNLQNETDAYILVFTSPTQPPCEGNFYFVAPDQVFPDTFTSFQMRG
ncbi:hypothetical protein LRE75_35725 [Streptomyces sp. 372A]